MTLEVEFKLSVSPKDLARIRKSPQLASVDGKRPSTRRLYSVYYDTSDEALRKRGVALRLRKSAGHWIQTVKLAGTQVGGLEFRPEYEAPTPAQLLNWTALEQTPVADVFADAAIRHALAPGFVTDFRRTARHVRINADNLVEVAFDIGVIRAQEREAPLCEIELELKEGTPEHLFDLAKQIVALAPSAQIEVRSKAERGYALAKSAENFPHKARAVALRAEQSITDAFATIASTCLHHFQANVVGVIESDDIEYVHQARVAIRRLRSCFSVFRSVIPKTEATNVLAVWRELATRLGEVRDLDVITHVSLPLLQLEVTDDLQPLIAVMEQQRLQARRLLREHLATGQQTANAIDLGAALFVQPWRAHWTQEMLATAELPLIDFATRVLKRRYKRVRRHAASAFETKSAADVHAFRIEMKKLRYAAEFFGALFSIDTIFAKNLESLQEALGQFNDDAVLLNHLETIESIEKPTIAFVRGFVSARHRFAVAQLEKAWHRAESTPVFWRTQRKSRH